MQKSCLTAARVAVVVPLIHAGAVNAGDQCFPVFSQTSVDTAVPPEILAAGMTSAFLNDDEFPDLVLVGFAATGILLGRGDGSFDFHSAFPSVANPDPNVVVVDINGDSFSDIIVQGESRISIHYGLGGNVYSLPTTVPISSGGGYASAATADFDGDGIQDLLLPRDGSLLMRIYGVSGFGPHPAEIVPGVFGVGGRWQFFDVNGDGLLDIVDENDFRSKLFLAGQGGVFLEMPDHFDPAAIEDSFVVFNSIADGRAIQFGGSGGFGARDYLYELRPDGSKSLLEEYPDHQDYSRSQSRFAVADIDGNGTDDVVALLTTNPTYGIGLLRQRSSGEFFEYTYAPFGIVSNLQRPVIEDFNLDGRPDLAVFRESGSLSVQVFLNELDFCEADLDRSCVLDLSDVGAFVDAFLGQTPAADLDESGTLDLGDVVVFIDSFTGCLP